MENKTDILLLTATFGLGHKSAAQAIVEHVKRENEDIKMEIVDIFQIINPKLYKSLYKGYEFLITKNSKLYNYFYYKKYFNEHSQLDDWFYKICLPKLTSYISSIHPKMIIATFPVGSGLASKYKEEYQSDLPIISCITDVVDSWEWIYHNIDQYFVATEEIKNKLIQKGVSEKKIAATGIPIRVQFEGHRNELEKLKKIKKSDGFTILIMGGGMGLLPKEREFYIWLDELRAVKTTILTGNNKEIYNRLKQNENLKNLAILEYTENVSALMNDSDLLVTKAGGVTLFEGIKSHLPIIAFKPSLGQEIENSKFITQKNIGMVANNFEELKIGIRKILNDTRYRKELYKNIVRVSDKINMDILVQSILGLYNQKEKMKKVNI
ncbi:MGDG synthase family glycosyltransferase [Inediibacterium massiliense]|uniref:MGDG synthase family glycosyltransferase n=1 Tax=Inediibacterium massiliense TaxID=1658111 RepID=UPI0006B59454|nr:glycosyltransferase [Inediibacterium massiliense]